MICEFVNKNLLMRRGSPLLAASCMNVNICSMKNEPRIYMKMSRMPVDELILYRSLPNYSQNIYVHMLCRDLYVYLRNKLHSHAKNDNRIDQSGNSRNLISLFLQLIRRISWLHRYVKQLSRFHVHF